MMHFEFSCHCGGIHEPIASCPNLVRVTLFSHTGVSELKGKGPSFSEKDWYYLQAQTDMPFHYLKLVV